MIDKIECELTAKASELNLSDMDEKARRAETTQLKNYKMNAIKFKEDSYPYINLFDDGRIAIDGVFNAAELKQIVAILEEDVVKENPLEEFEVRLIKAPNCIRGWLAYLAKSSSAYPTLIVKVAAENGAKAKSKAITQANKNIAAMRIVAIPNIGIWAVKKFPDLHRELKPIMDILEEGKKA